MKKFDYKFESILTIKGIFEDQAERNFREAIQEYAQNVEKLEQLRDQLRILILELAEHRQRSVDIQIQLLYEEYLTHLRQKIEKQQEIVRLSEEKVEERRAELMEAMKERKTFENLKVKDYERYLVELKRWEQAVIDDLTTLRHAGSFGSSGELSA